MNFNVLKFRHFFRYRQFNVQQLCVLPSQCVDLRTNSDYFPMQQKLIGF